MKLKWQQLSTLHKSPRPLTLLASKDPFFLRYGLDFIKKNTGDKKLESIIIDKQFNWQDWYHHEVMAQDLFGTQAKIFMIHLSEKLNKDAEAILNQLADETSPHQFILLGTQFSEKAKWLKNWHNRYYTITFWPLQKPEFENWLKQAVQLYGYNLEPRQIATVAANADRSPEVALQTIEKLALMPQPITVETIQNVMSQTKSIQVFDLQEAIVKRDPKMAKHYYNELRHNQTPLALLNWLFKTEVMRLLKLKLSDNPSQTVNQLGIHFSQKQLYLKNCATWHLNQLKQLLKQSEKLEACMIGYKPEQAPQIMLDLIYQLIYLPKCQTA